MYDLISRQAAIAEFSCCELTPDGGIDANYAIEFLENLPAAQPDIIRCKDCKYADEDGVCQSSKGLAIQDDDDFCSKAERREG